MVLSGVMIEESRLNEFKVLGAKDSKLLTPKKREELFSKIKDIAEGTDIQIITVEKIDSRESDGLNLNDLEAVMSARIINMLKPDKAIIDCPSPNIRAWADTVKKYLTHQCEIQAAHKADRDFPIVGAASILAKVTRDSEVTKIQKKIPYPIGSGYITDPITKKFVEEHHAEFPEIFRKTWASYRTAAEKKNKRLDEF